jgi:ABC-type branched-subunit amino acid transport system substrate-binding protein
MSTPLGTQTDDAHPQELREYRDIETLYGKGLFESTQGRILSFSKQHPHSSLLPSVENIYGLLLLRGKKPTQAILHFKKAIRLNPRNQTFNQYILYNLAMAQFDANQIEEARETTSDINLELLDKTNRIKIYYLKANIFEKKSLPIEASRQLLSAGRLFTEIDTYDNRKIFNKLLDQSLQSISDLASLEKLYQEFEDSTVADSLLFRLGSQEIALGNAGNGELHLKTLMSRFPHSAYFAQANELLNHSQDQVAVDSRSIGILLPMKGKFSKFGARSLQGIELAFGIFNPSESDSKFNLVIEDSGEEPDQAIQALNRLVLKHHVVAVIGPMVSKGVDQISQRAQELGVPLISLSRKAGPNYEYVFQAGLTQQLQAYEAARYAIQQLGIRKFAIIFPNEKFGSEMSQSFWDAVQNLGGKIVGVESYRPGETDFRQAVDKLSGLYYSDARQRELDLLAQEREANQIKKRTRKTEQFFSLKPVVDYEAVFIPDEAKVAGQILPTFAYRDVEGIKFLGTSSWNTLDFLSRAQSYGENATFVDAFFPESNSSSSKKFYEKYRSTFNQDPSSLEALAYDAGLLLQSVLSSGRSISRADLRDRLKNVRDFPGVTGKLSFKEGQFFRDLKVLTVKNGHFVEAR